ncbi:hypothetical protein HLB23_39440 [Nocardia uniformis]|uniref:Uncharacterized protein n=1 Tax=Nocardia uniformis TaxID=53432 RepID=A0A849CBE7_9NOCA|nr:hypothetical protein [Nocardia uniformis]NNH75862.1 hypothetical protein [Nocardia uniformis]
MSSDHTPGIDWDGELQALMEASGIDPGYAARLSWADRCRQRVRQSRPIFWAVGATVVAMWWTARCGAPAAATGPLLVWLAGWLGYWAWIGLGRPDWSAIAHTSTDFGTRGFRAVTRFGFRHSRPARARWRAWQAARERDRAATAPATAA